MTARSHLFPSRTQKLSSLVLKILTGYPVGKISSRQIFFVLIMNFFVLKYENLPFVKMLKFHD